MVHEIEPIMQASSTPDNQDSGTEERLYFEDTFNSAKIVYNSEKNKDPSSEYGDIKCRLFSASNKAEYKEFISNPNILLVDMTIGASVVVVYKEKILQG